MLDHSKTVVTQSTLASKFNDLLKGAITPFLALKLIFNHSRLLSLSLAPIISAVIVFSLMIYALLAGLWTFAHSTFIAFINSYSGIFFVLAAILTLSALSFFAVSFLTFFVSLLASPFNDILAEKTELALGESDVPHWSVGRLFRIFWIDLRKSILTLFTALIFSLGLLIPVANVLFFIGLALLNTFTFITYPQSRREHGLAKSLLWIGDHLFLSLGFGITTLLLFSIPVIDIFALPISVVGGTILFCDSNKKS